MVNKTRSVTLYRIFLWTSAAIVTLALAFVFVIVAIPENFGAMKIPFAALSLVVALFFSMIASLSASAITSQKRFLAQIREENLYVFGENTQFYNLDAFKLRVNRLCRRHPYSSMHKYITVFTPTAINIATNKSRASILKALNFRLTRFLDEMFDPNNKNGFDHNRNVYGFSRGFFFLCTFTNDASDVHRILNALSNEMFRMVNEDKVKIWVQPFYGICELKKSSSIVVAVEEAMLARDISEKNYESYTFFKESFRKEDSSLSAELIKALDNNEFVPFYQPKYSIQKKRYVSSEALARWNSPVHGLLAPGKFIEAAESAGLLHAIDLKIFELTVRDLSDSIKRGRPVLPVSVNFSLYEFFSRNFYGMIAGTLEKYHVPPKLIEIEITETTSQVNKFLSLAVIKKIKALGIRVLMDDFGVGYSQVENLRQIPFDAIKIDKSYTDRLQTDEKTRSIFKYLVELGHVNDMEVIVEGVENKEQVDILRKMKVDTIQGFYYSRPIPLDAYFELLKNENGEKGGKE